MIQKYRFFLPLQMHELTMELALQKSHNAEHKSQFEG